MAKNNLEEPYNPPPGALPTQHWEDKRHPPDLIPIQFRVSVSRALDAWQSIETSLFVMFQSLIGSSDELNSAVAYHAAQQFSTKLNMVHALLLHQIPDKRFRSKVIEPLISSLIKANKDRNDLVHGTVILVTKSGSRMDKFGTPTRVEAVLVKGPWDPRSIKARGMHRIPYNKVLTEQQISDMISKFSDVYHVMADDWVEIEKQLALPEKSHAERAARLKGLLPRKEQYLTPVRRRAQRQTSSEYQ